MRFTVLGGAGFIGRALLSTLRAQGQDAYAPDRDGIDWQRHLGHVIYAIGLTADFRERPFDTVGAHVSALAEVLRRGTYDSLLYLSSARVYRGAADTSEDASLVVRPSQPDDMYNLSKLLGESLCLTSPLPTVRAARLANVYGSDLESANFLSSILREAASGGEARFHTSFESAKDYVAIEDVVDLALRIAVSGRARLYNVASGRNVAHREIGRALGDLGVRCSVDPRAPAVTDQAIRIDRIVDEFAFSPRALLPRLPELYGDFVARFGGEARRSSA